MPESAIPARPSLCLFASELHRATFEMATLLPAYPWLRAQAKGDGQPVIVLPGFGAADYSTVFLRKYLNKQGFDAYPWGLGMNLDPRELGDMYDTVEALNDALDAMVARVQDISSKTGKKVSLIGWSLGGVLSRAIAGRLPDYVQQVITLGSPIGDIRAVSISPLITKLRGTEISDEDAEAWTEFAQPDLGDIPINCLFSDSDGFLSPEIAKGEAAENVHYHRVAASHVGFGVNPLVYAKVAQLLAANS